MSRLTQQTLEMIAEKRIRPISAWVSRLRNGLYWGGVAVLIVLSVITTAVSWHAIFEIDWLAYFRAHFSWLEILISGVPLFSLFLLGIFLWAGSLLLQQTRRGYRYPLYFLTGVFLMGSLACGYFLEGSPLDEPTERFFLRALPHSETLSATLIPSAERQWSQPERGLLGGAVLSSGTTDMTLLDTSQKLWTVDYSQATLDESVSLDPYEQVKMIGNQDGEDTFQATEIKKWDQPESSKKQIIKNAPVLKEQKKTEEQTRQKEADDERTPQVKGDHTEKKTDDAVKAKDQEDEEKEDVNQSSDESDEGGREGDSGDDSDEVDN